MEYFQQLLQALKDYGIKLNFLILPLTDFFFRFLFKSKKESILESKSKTKLAIGNFIRYEKSKHLKKID